MTEQLDNKHKLSENMQLIKRCHTVVKLVLLLLLAISSVDPVCNLCLDLFLKKKVKNSAHETAVWTPYVIFVQIDQPMLSREPVINNVQLI